MGHWPSIKQAKITEMALYPNFSSPNNFLTAENVLK
jgi:hypothetical protein